MDASGMDNDTRGWVLCLVSAIACVFGAAIICVDIFIRLLPGHRTFNIQDSNAFLACSLSLSFGVMLFSALYNMLPSSKTYLEEAGYGDQAAGLILMAGFMGGFLGIQIVSRVLHQFMPSHVVDCDHSHEESAIESRARSTSTSRRHSRSRSLRRKDSAKSHHSLSTHNDGIDNMSAVESTPLLGALNRIDSQSLNNPRASMPGRKPSILRLKQRVMSFVNDTTDNCDQTGPCYGYTDPCGQECFKHVSSRVSTLRTTGSQNSNNSASAPNSNAPDDDAALASKLRTSRAQSRDVSGTTILPPPTAAQPDQTAQPHQHHHHHHHHDFDSQDHHRNGDHNHGNHENGAVTNGFHNHHSHHTQGAAYHANGSDNYDDDSDNEHHNHHSSVADQHHHHVPTNAFMSIGLQTSIAIALHKFPEGFITYATNHANPALGFNVFMALFVHNISEGFALALPLYMALGSRWRAMIWASILGGLSQPLGAAIAVLWFHLSDKAGHFSPSAVVYACLFSVTAGIMASVALQLFVESLSLNHNRNMSIFFAFLGMSILGLSGALVGEGHSH